jgi:UDPglucose 6-dehydrogenase
MKLAVVGLGKLGLPLAEVLAERHKVSGYDISPRKSDTVRIAPSAAEAADGAAAVFVVLPTPHDPRYDGSRPTADLPARDFDYEAVRSVLSALDEAVGAGISIAVVSTVLPGTMRREFAPLVQRHELLYTPAFMAMGRVREDFLDPEFRLLGSADGDPGAGMALQDVYASFGCKAPVHLVTWEEAEAVKIFYNVFISMKISLANTVQDLSQRIGHLDSDRVTAALQAATRRLWSPMYTKAGMGDGGPCHPRDLIALRHLAERFDLGYDVFGAVAQAREAQARNMADYLVSFGLPVLVTSKAFKPGVTYVDGSSSLLVASWVAQAGTVVRFLDDAEPAPPEPHVVLLAHDVDNSGIDVPEGSIVVDPWRRYASQRYRVIHYGNTRPGAEGG